MTHLKFMLIGTALHLYYIVPPVFSFIFCFLYYGIILHLRGLQE